MSKKLYTFATKTHIVYGHGEADDELHIQKHGGSYGDIGAKFLPLFLSIESAENWKTKHPDQYGLDDIVELEVYDE